MIYIKENIERIASLKGLNITMVLEQAGIARNTFYHQVKKEIVTIGVLEKIAQVLNVKISELVCKPSEKMEAAEPSVVYSGLKEKYYELLEKYNKALEENQRLKDILSKKKVEFV